MRWIFFFLLTVNCILLLWRFTVGVPASYSMSVAPVIESASKLALPSIKLVAELDQPPPQRSDAVSFVTPPGVGLCTMVGPFSELKRAEAWTERLNALEVDGQVRQIELSLRTRHWIYLPPLASRDEARRSLARLQGKGIDSYVVHQGEHENAISLGVFAESERAKARMAELKAMGLSPILGSLDQTDLETWVVLGPGEEAKIGERAWVDLLNVQNNLGKRQNSCLDVASR